MDMHAGAVGEATWLLLCCGSCPRLSVFAKKKGVLSYYHLATTKIPRLALDGGTKLPSYIIAICAGQSALESASSASRPTLGKKKDSWSQEKKKNTCMEKREVPEGWVFLFLDSSGKARTSNLLINNRLGGLLPGFALCASVDGDPWGMEFGGGVLVERVRVGFVKG